MADVSTATKHFPVASELYVSALSASILSNAATVPVITTSAYAEGDTVVLTIDANTAQEATFTGQKSGNTYIDCKWTEGNLGVGHSNGAPVIDYDSATHYNLLTKAMRLEHNDDGSHKDVVTPSGAIIGFGGSTAPSGWALCEGQAISRTSFAKLFAAIGTAYGVGDGTTTFNVPNLKGKMPVGRDAAQTEFDVLAETGGAKTHTLTVAQIPVHTHTNVWRAFMPSGTGSLVVNDSGGDATLISDNASGGVNGSDVAGNPSIVNNTGGGTSHPILNPYIVINYIIKT